MIPKGASRHFVDGQVPLIDVQNLRVRSRKIPSGSFLVDDVSYQIFSGDSLAIVGESGAGKSIGVRAALGLLPHRSFDIDGSIIIQGQSLDSVNRRERTRLITNSSALVFQDPLRSLNPTMRIGPQVAEAMFAARSRPNRRKKKAANERALELLRLVGIADPVQRFRAYPHELSGGMRQRIVIAIALSCEPKVIFCDEPTTALDVTTQAQILDLLDELRTRLGIAVVLITHDLALAASRTDRIIVMYSGQIVEQMESKSISSGSQMPYTQALLAAVPGITSDGEIPTPIPGIPPDPSHRPQGCNFSPRCLYATQECHDEMPVLRSLRQGHSLRCWNPLLPLADSGKVEISGGQEELRRGTIE